MTVNYYVGWTGVPWNTDLMPAPAAPSNYKDPAKIAVAVEEKREKQLASAGSIPIYGKLESVCVLNDRGEVVFSHTSGDTHDPLYSHLAASTGHQEGVDDVSANTAFLDFMLSTFQFPTEDADYELTDGSGHSVRLIGLEVKTALKMAAMQSFAASNVCPIDPFDIPTRMWYRRTFCVDPFEMLRAGVPDLTIESAMTFVGFDPAMLGEQTVAYGNATVARELATHIGIAQAGDIVDPALAPF